MPSEEQWQPLRYALFVTCTLCNLESILPDPLQKKADAELAKARETEKAARSYDTLFSGADEPGENLHKSVKEMEEDFM